MSISHVPMWRVYVQVPVVLELLQSGEEDKIGDPVNASHTVPESGAQYPYQSIDVSGNAPTTPWLDSRVTKGARL